MDFRKAKVSKYWIANLGVRLSSTLQCSVTLIKKERLSKNLSRYALLSLVPGTPVKVDGENQPFRVVLCLPHDPCGLHLPTHIIHT